MAVDLTKGSTIWSFYGKLVDPFNLDVSMSGLMLAESHCPTTSIPMKESRVPSPRLPTSP